VRIPIDQAIAGVRRPGPAIPPLPRLLIAGATGVLGKAVLQRLVGMQRISHTQVLARLPIRQGLRHVSAHVVPAGHQGHDDFEKRPASPADMAIVMLDPPRMFYGRERALWTPTPQQLPGLAAWIKRCGVHTMAIVLAHVQGSLPETLKRRLASLDEQAIATLAPERLFIVRTTQKPAAALQPRNVLHRTASWMLGVSSYMVPRSEQPVRASKVAEFIDLALLSLPPGIYVAAPELVWHAAQGNPTHMRQVLAQWASPGTPATVPAATV
jgi:hypothetical protein